MYHQVCAKPSDPWDMAVTPACFEEQLRYITRNFDVVPLDELAAQMRRKKIRRRLLAVTFDDGFRDNFTTARPLLEAYHVPATFYVATHAMPSGVYWWDELEQLILHTAVLPPTLKLNSLHTFKFEFLKHAELDEKLAAQIRAWKAGAALINERVALFYALWALLRPLPFNSQQAVMQHLRSWAGVYSLDRTYAEVMTFDEMLRLADNPLFSIGAHTVHHTFLSAHSAEGQAFEVIESKKTIESWLGRTITGFAYPYGNYNSTTKNVLHESGFQYAVSTVSRPLTQNDDLFEMPRIQVRNVRDKQFATEIHQLLAI